MSVDDELARADAWEQKYQLGKAGWDLGRPAPGLVTWLGANPGRDGRAIVPGCGPGHDAVALAKHGFEVVAIDFAPSAIAATRALAEEAGVRLTALEADLFALPADLDGTADLVFEHTCFCALPRDRRGAYRDVLARLTRPGGLLLGVFFTFPDDGSGPPFPIACDDLPGAFAPAFALEVLTPVLDSVARRRGEEHLALLRRLPR